MMRRLLLCAMVGLPYTAAGAQRSPAEMKALARDRLAVIDGQIGVAGLDSAVEVRRDQWGVPHIYAKTQHDLFFAQGFVAAQDRLFQMEIWKRTGEGTLAEVFGPAYVERDRFARLLKYRGDMTAEWTSYAPDARQIVGDFIAGINAYIATVRDRPPVEFTLLGFAPKPWTATVPLQRLAALSMTGNAEYEVLRAQLVATLGAKRVDSLWPTIPHRDLDPAPGMSLRGITTRSLGAYDEAVGSLSLPRVEGSNNWVVSGALTATGKPLLANDPHRVLGNPSLRYLTHIVGPGWNVIGAGEPGVPGVAAGHNERIGFGFTIVGMDQQDLYVETMRRCGSRLCYLQRGVWKPVREVNDTIRVKGEEPRAVRLQFTTHGPLVRQDSADASGRWRGFALRFVGSEPGTAGYLAQLSVNRAHDWRSFLAAAERWKLPTENLIYADVDGNIGWIAAGLMPKRSWSGLLPVPGTGAYEWSGFRSVVELPQSFNPASGFIVTANHDIRPPGYDIPLNYEFATPFRARRIEEVITAARAAGIKFSVEDFQRLQHDEASLQAREIVPVLLGAAQRRGTATRWEYRTLAAWDYLMRPTETAPLLFESWKRALSESVLRRRAGTAADTAAAILGAATWLDDWEHTWTPLVPLPGRVRDTLMLAAMDTALARLRVRLGADTSGWRWGEVHTAAFPHRVARTFDLAPVARGGDAYTVNSTSGSNYRQTAGASFREILDLSDWDRSVATSVPGQSGQPESEHYGDLLPLWASGRYFPLAYSRAAVERDTKHILLMKPAGTSTSQR